MSCPELDAELEVGKRAARDLVAHLHRMGAGGLEIPVQHVEEYGSLTFWKVSVVSDGKVTFVESAQEGDLERRAKAGVELR